MAHGVEQRVRRPGDPDPGEKTRDVRSLMQARRREREEARKRDQQREDGADG